jgi:parallel beta-helix repeat protein
LGGGFEPCYNNVFSENTIANNDKGIEIDYSKSKFYHNNIIGNGIQTNVYTTTFAISWDNGYPSGGSYWRDYVGVARGYCKQARKNFCQEISPTVPKGKE